MAIWMAAGCEPGRHGQFGYGWSLELSLKSDYFLATSGCCRAVADNDSDESEKVQTVLNSASEKFGIHFEGQRQHHYF